MKLKKLLFITLSISFILIASIFSNAQINLSQLAGADRYETAGKIADKLNYDTVILVNSDNSLADGLSASGLAGVTNSPILLTQKNSIPKSTEQRINNNVKNTYIIGGTSAISDTVANILKNKNINVTRLEGSDRIQTSLNVAKEISKFKTIDKIALVNGYKEADAMSISPVAVKNNFPVILTDGKISLYNTKNLRTYVVGGSSVMSESIASDSDKIVFAGTDRFDTNKKVFSYFYGSSVNDFYVANGYKLVDALTGSTVAKDNGIIFVDGGSDKSVLKNATSITTLGYLDNSIVSQLQNLDNANTPKIVYWVSGGSVYHSTKDCPSLQRSKNIYSGTIEESKKTRPCKDCF
ncbi:MAG: cell wall-binding repeat-containing protein [Clostridioides sp.]|jgi:putative cell wall-binding protein|nr:cell wall-binding repeat-containing protein [Clostridioides sp.]